MKVKLSQNIDQELLGNLASNLKRLSGSTRRSKSFLAAKAVAAYVDRELAIIDGIQRGQDLRHAGGEDRGAGIARVAAGVLRHLHRHGERRRGRPGPSAARDEPALMPSLCQSRR